MYTLKYHHFYYRQEPLIDPPVKLTPSKEKAIKFKTKVDAEFVLREHRRLNPNTNSNLRVAELT